MAKIKATKGDSKGKSIESVVDDMKSDHPDPKPIDLLSVELPELDVLVAEAVCAEVLRGNYIETLKRYQETHEDLKKDAKKKMIELLEGFEIMISWLDQSDKWLNDLHEGKLEKQSK